MLLSLGLILLGGFVIGLIFEVIKIPRIIGMIFVGILFGPSVLNIIDIKVLSISAELRMIALVVILTRSGLSLDLKKLKELGRPAILMCFLPATFEIIGVLVFAPMLLGISHIEALLLGSVLGAVSPAVVVPRMINLKKNGYGNDKGIPEIIMAGASADDIYVIVLFYSFLGLLQSGNIDVISIIQIPSSIVLGVLFGIGIGFVIVLLFRKFKVDNIVKVLILLSISFLMIALEEILKDYISISALLGIMTIGIVLSFKDKVNAREIERSYQKIWYFFEILLFVLVGISVNLDYAFSAGLMPLLLLAIALLFRMVGVLVSLLFTKLNWKERLYCVLSYIPKATVQASIGGIALSLGLPVGNLVLTISVLAILITAPLGAILMDNLYKRLLRIGN